MTDFWCCSGVSMDEFAMPYTRKEFPDKAFKVDPGPSPGPSANVKVVMDRWPTCRWG